MKNVALLLALAVGAVAAPTATWFGAATYGEYRQASMRHADLQRQQRDLDAYSEQVAQYRRFAARVERFIGAARAAGVADESWNRHHVDIKDRVLSLAELAQFIEDAGGGDSYYFLPERLQIQASRSGGSVNPFRGRSAARSPDVVSVSLSGYFLVPVQ